MLGIVANYHCMQFQGKLISPTGEKDKKLNFGPDLGPFWPKYRLQKLFSWVLPLLDVIHCCKLSLYAMKRKTNKQTWKNGKKSSFGPDFGLFGPNSSYQFFFFKNLAFSVTRYHSQLSSCTISEKSNDPIERKLSDGQTDKQTDGETDESDFIGCCPTNIEHPKWQLCR